MDICRQCGTAVISGRSVCDRCAEQTIHAQGEVIPPDTATVSQSSTERDRFATALAVAVAADLLQLVFFPMFGEGAMSPLNDALDVAVALVLSRLVGWHWVFLPSFLGELVPVLDELPCWTLAVLFVRGEQAKLQSA